MSFFRFRLTAAIVVLAACCGGGDGGPTEPNGDNNLASIQLTPSGSAPLAAGATLTVTVVAYNGNNQIIQNPGTPTFSSANPGVAEIDSQGEVLGLSAGAAQINVSLTRGGVTKTASVTINVNGSLPVNTLVSATTGFDDGYGNTSGFLFTPRKVAIAVNGTVNWTFGSVEHTVTFSGAGSQNNITSGYLTTIGRTFTTAGTYSYVCTIHPGMGGTVIVR
jgi:plastocyanin